MLQKQDKEGELKENAINHPLCPDEFWFLHDKEYIDLPNITEREIKDRSKGDILSKSLTVIQTGCFVVQCIARLIADLQVTELELTTVAIAVTNTATYLFWWNKPLNVECTVPVPLKRPISKEDWNTCMQYIRGPHLGEEKGEALGIDFKGVEKELEVVGDTDSKPIYGVPEEIPTATKEGRIWPIILFQLVRTENAMEKEHERRIKEKRVHPRYSGNLGPWWFFATFFAAGFLAVSFAAIHLSPGTGGQLSQQR